ncbi:Uncharacterised protein [Raoultella terrigena]|uniref:Uncharacterized protein n=1 Tax=Raoultella terrigena TaxID=577 RepID=A0A3P8KQC3_RAOTE|nr:Uncharacterised protein [Raoultella terrigena]
MKPRVKAIVAAAALLCAAGSPMALGAPAEGKSSMSTGKESVRAKAPDSAKVGGAGGDEGQHQ